MNAMPSHYRIVHESYLRLVYAESDHGAVEPTVTGMRKAMRFLGERFGFQWPLLNVFVAPNRVEFDQLVSHLTTTPTQPSRLGQPQGHDLYLLSPEAWPSDAHPGVLRRDGRYDPGIYQRMVLHEVVHMAEEHMSPRGAMEVRPAWFSEGLAVYLSEQYRMDHALTDRMRTKLEHDRLPALSDMYGPAAYLWGWTVIRFLESRFGWERIAAVIRETKTSAVLDSFGEDLESEWLQGCEPEALRGEIGSFGDSSARPADEFNSAPLVPGNGLPGLGR